MLFVSLLLHNFMLERKMQLRIMLNIPTKMGENGQWLKIYAMELLKILRLGFIIGKGAA